MILWILTAVAIILLVVFIINKIRSTGTPPEASSGNPFKPPAMEFSKDPINTLQALKKKVNIATIFSRSKNDFPRLDLELLN
jgi:hypothetical protein